MTVFCEYPEEEILSVSEISSRFNARNAWVLINRTVRTWNYALNYNFCALGRNVFLSPGRIVVGWAGQKNIFKSM